MPGMKIPRKNGMGLLSCLVATVATAILFCGCNNSDSFDEDELPGDRSLPTCPPNDDGLRYISFGGRCWKVRSAPAPEGPGRNLFSDDARNVWVDESGRLHMKIAFRDGRWFCSEIYSEGVGYGVYRFFVSCDAATLDRNVVLGFFTWDPGTLAAGQLNEIDIELTKWGKTTDYNLHHTVQPSSGPDSSARRYMERDATYAIPRGTDRTLHSFIWTPPQIRFASYSGWRMDDDNLLATWDFTHDNPPRRSDDYPVPVVIPAPTSTTSIRINLWLFNSADDDGLGDPPTDNRDVEVVIDGFSYHPL